MLNDWEIEDAAQALAKAEQNADPIPPLSDTYPQIDVDDAYVIQLANIEKRLHAGRIVKGHKVGLTSIAMQKQLGVHEADYGHLLDDMFVSHSGSIVTSALCAPRVEAEIAFVLDRDLRGPGLNVADVLSATAFVLPAIEIIDSRVSDWRITLPDTIADNASSARVVLGGMRCSVENLDLTCIGATLRKNGQVVETGSSDAVLGNPATAVCWLANKLASFDRFLGAGQVVLSGSCIRATGVVAMDLVRADLEGLGSVEVQFI